MKFSTKISLINVSVESEDEPDWRNSSGDTAKIPIFPDGLPMSEKSHYFWRLIGINRKNR